MILMPLLASDLVPYTFSVTPTVTVKQVHLAGSFNGWDRRATRMEVGPDGKTYSVTLRLQPGRHTYKFVLDDNTWITDPAAETVADGDGNRNSVLLLLPEDYRNPASRFDGRTAASAVQHLTEAPFFNYDRGNLLLSLRARPGDLQSVSVQVSGAQARPMREEPIDELYSRYVVEIPWNRKSDLSYQFILRDGQKQLAFGPKGLGSESSVGSFRVEKSYQPFTVPAWVERSVLYQIFPDRFANGDKSNDPQGTVAWDAKPLYYNTFGGDVAGVRKNIGYLKSLGVDCVYFNPIFKSPSNHRYDATDYLKLDPTFGTNEEFAALTRLLKAKSIRTVLDGVYNHTATDFFAFKDIREKGEASAYTKWYTIHSYPVKVQNNPNYAAWFNFPSMPKLNLENSETRDYMLKIPHYWHKNAEIAGWRLDVANEVIPEFWREFRKTVKGIDSEDWIVGEVWGDGSPWLKGDQWDSVMNYRFRNAVLGFVSREGSGKPSDLMNRLMDVYRSYAPQVSRNMMNLLGSHDTPRILTLCGNDRDLAKLAAVIQFTWVGAPSIYYGDELGMEGGADPDNRRGMRWDTANNSNDFLKHYQLLTSIRKRSRALQSGDPRVLLQDDFNGVAAYARVLGRESAVVALNRSSSERQVEIPLSGLPASSNYTNALTGERVRADRKGFLSVIVPAKQAAVLIPN